MYGWLYLAGWTTRSPETLAKCSSKLINSEPSSLAFTQTNRQPPCATTSSGAAWSLHLPPTQSPTGHDLSTPHPALHHHLWQFQAGQTSDAMAYVEWASLVQMADNLKKQLRLLTGEASG
jgi:hypothetical protein